MNCTRHSGIFLMPSNMNFTIIYVNDIKFSKSDKVGHTKNSQFITVEELVLKTQEYL